MTVEYLVRGRITAPHGVAGAVRLATNTDFPERLLSAQSWLLRMPGGELRECRVEEARPHKGMVVAKLAGVDDRNAAEALRGAEVVVDPADLEPLPEGEYYWHELLGLEVITIEGRRLGAIREIIQTGSNDVYVTPEALIPAIREVIEEVDLAAGVMRIRPLPGLLD